MPPLDVGSLVLRDDGGAELEATSAPSYSDCDPYAPAESLRLRIGEDIDWSDVVGAVAVAAVLERDDSTKGAAANPKSCAATAARSSLSAPAAPRAVAVVTGGLPAARDHGRRRSPCQLQLQLGLGGGAKVFASGEAAGAHHHQAEPGSPKVSCLGGVRSQPRTAAEGITSGGRGWWPPTSCSAAAAGRVAATGGRGRAKPRVAKAPRGRGTGHGIRTSDRPIV